MSMEDKRLEYKVQALLEKIGSLTTNYEDTHANMRVELTMQSMRADQAEAELAALKQAMGEANEVSQEVPDAEQG